MGKKIGMYLVGAFLIFLVIFTSIYGAISLFRYPKIIWQSLGMVIFFNLFLRYFLKQDVIKSKAKILEGGLVWRVKQNRKLKLITLIILGFIETLILSYGYAPGREGFEKTVVFALLLPLMLSAFLLI